MSNLTILAKIKAHEGSEEDLLKELTPLICYTRTEEGCIEYTLHRSIEDSTLFMFYETWQNKALWEKHLSSQNFLEFSSSTKNLIASFELYQLTKEQ